jgi:hypothetical protein
MQGLRHDTTGTDVRLALAVLERRRALIARGAFHAIGHLEGRHYEDRLDPRGTLTRCWVDGEMEVLPELPPAERPGILRGHRWSTYFYHDLPSLPESPGTYVAYSALWVAYVGESSSLRSRWQQHALKVIGYDADRQPILSHRDWGTIGEFRLKVRLERRYGERLMREARLIRKLRPKFNRSDR